MAALPEEKKTNSEEPALAERIARLFSNSAFIRLSPQAILKKSFEIQLFLNYRSLTCYFFLSPRKFESRILDLHAETENFIIESNKKEKTFIEK